MPGHSWATSSGTTSSACVEFGHRALNTVSRLRRLSARGPIVIIDCLRAAIELALANHRFRTLPPGQLVDHVRRPGRTSIEPGNHPTDSRLVERVAYAIPAVALRVPWRSDCMVQAMAAQSWLASYGITSMMTIGVRKDAPEGFGAHAWLSVGEVLVTGGDISSYVAIDVRSANLEAGPPAQ